LHDVFRRDLGGPGSWGHEKALTALDGQQGDHYGAAVALAGGLVLVGGPRDSGEEPNQGAAYVADVRKLRASVSTSFAQVGESLTSSGGTVVVGAPRENAAYVFEGALVVPPNVWAVYCTAGTSSAGCRASLTGCGQASASAPSGFYVTASGVEGPRNGTFFFSATGRQAKPWGQPSSYLCALPPLVRVAHAKKGVGTAGSCDGFFQVDLNAQWALHPGKNPGPGATVQAQLWYRDSGNPGFSLSDALELPVGP